MKVRLFTRQFAVSLLVHMVTLFALGLPAVHAAEPGKLSAAEDMQVTQPYARAVVASQLNSGVYMTLSNSGQADHAIVKISGTVARAVEMHGHLNDNGILRMRPVAKITIPAGGETRLQPGGMHVMLIGLNQTLEAGGVVHLELTFEDGSRKIIRAPVKDVQAMMRGHDSHHDSSENREHEDHHGPHYDSHGDHNMHDMKEHGHDDSHREHEDHHDLHKGSHHDSHHDSNGDQDMHDKHHEQEHGHNR